MLIGLIGKPNCGKSTFFKASTLAEVLIANYPFATIKPNHGVGYVKVEDIGPEFNVISMPQKGFLLGKWRFVPIELYDVAGLVPGASEGKGLGNQFLDNLTAADVLIHIVDASGTTDIEGKPAENHDPIKDIEFLEQELTLWYLNILKKVWKTFARKTEQENQEIEKAITKQFSGLKINEDQVKIILKKLDFKQSISNWTDDQLYQFSYQLLKYSKPIIIAANKSDHENAEANIKKIESAFPDYLIYPCSADSELALREASKHDLIDYIPGENNFKIKKELNDKQKQALEKIKKNVLDKFGGTGVQEILNLAVFDLLKYIAIFPAGANKLADQFGNVLPDCFLLPEGSTALDFAYKIHKD
ncbi:MAG: redox-regulated ATPase YchF, partial [Nanoarchaeota archaeon]